MVSFPIDTPFTRKSTDTIDPLALGAALAEMVTGEVGVTVNTAPSDGLEIPTLVGGRAKTAVAAKAAVQIDAAIIRRRKVFISGFVATYLAPLRVRGSALAGVTMVGF